MQTDIERFNAKWEPEPNTGCWLWTGGIAKQGYGTISFNGVMQGAHRFAWLLHHGEIPVDAQGRKLWVLHRCDTPACVNPDHLFLGTHVENMQDVRLRKRSPWIKKTHCPQGHPYDAENTYRHDRGRACRSCMRRRSRERQQRRKHTEGKSHL